MVAVRTSYRPPRSTPPRMKGLATCGLAWTSAISKAGGAADWAKTAREKTAAAATHLCLTAIRGRIMSHLLWNDRGLNLEAADVIKFGFSLGCSAPSRWPARH